MSKKMCLIYIFWNVFFTARTLSPSSSAKLLSATNSSVISSAWSRSWRSNAPSTHLWLTFHQFLPKAAGCVRNVYSHNGTTGLISMESCKVSSGSFMQFQQVSTPSNTNLVFMIPSNLVMVLIFKLPPQLTSHRCTFTWSYRRPCHDWSCCSNRGFGHWTTTQQMSTVQGTKRSCRWWCGSTLRFWSCILRASETAFRVGISGIAQGWFFVDVNCEIMHCYVKLLHNADLKQNLQPYVFHKVSSRNPAAVLDDVIIKTQRWGITLHCLISQVDFFHHRCCLLCRNWALLTWTSYNWLMDTWNLSNKKLEKLWAPNVQRTEVQAGPTGWTSVQTSGGKKGRLPWCAIHGDEVVKLPTATCIVIVFFTFVDCLCSMSFINVL